VHSTVLALALPPPLLALALVRAPMPDHPLAGPSQGGASSAWTPPTGHLRQRSITSARSRENSNTTNPFDDGHYAVPASPRGPHSPYGAALLRAQTSSTSLADEYTHAMGKEQAMAMRGDRAEWVRRSPPS